MDWIEALILGCIQGLTEFLPVSSSGHLTIGQEIMHLDTSVAENLQFDVTVHFATVLSTLLILRKEIFNIFKGTFGSTTWNSDKDYAAKLIISMFPIFIIGMFFKDFVEELFGSGLLLVGICLIITALLLCFAHFAKPRQKENISYLDAFIVGIAQAIAILPGLSRSGTTIATGILLGDKKEKVANFSFLMVIVPILGEAFLSLLKIAKEPSENIEWFPLLVGFLAAFLTGCFACKFMINMVKKSKLIYFAIYCVIIGVWAVIFAL